MQLIELFNQAKLAQLPESKAIYLRANPSLPDSKTLTDSELIEDLGRQEVFFADGLDITHHPNIFIGSTAYLTESAKGCDSFEEFVITNQW